MSDVLIAVVALFWFLAALCAGACMFGVKSRVSLGWACALFVILTQAVPAIAAVLR